MTTYYVDTSAAAKLMIEETESAELARWADREEVEPVATHLLETELRRLAHRLDAPQVAVTAVLDRVTLYDLPPSLYREAGALSCAALRSLDALHLAGALRLGVAALVTYDARLAEAAETLGMPVHPSRVTTG